MGGEEEKKQMRREARLPDQTLLSCLIDLPLDHLKISTVIDQMKKQSLKIENKRKQI